MLCIFAPGCCRFRRCLGFLCLRAGCPGCCFRFSLGCFRCRLSAGCCLCLFCRRTGCRLCFSLGCGGCCLSVLCRCLGCFRRSPGCLGFSLGCFCRCSGCGGCLGFLGCRSRCRFRFSWAVSAAVLAVVALPSAASAFPGRFLLPPGLLLLSLGRFLPLSGLLPLSPGLSLLPSWRWRLPGLLSLPRLHVLPLPLPVLLLLRLLPGLPSPYFLPGLHILRLLSFPFRFRSLPLLLPPRIP